MKKTILIVDPQNDFVNGSLAVPKAEEAMLRLADYLSKQSENELKEIIVTMDAHPICHSSFKAQGGPWPLHCVKYSVGAALYPPVMEALVYLNREKNIPIVFVEKGRVVEKEEYSAFQDALHPAILNASELEVGGIAGEYCVLNTLKDIVKHQYPMDKMRILGAYIGSFDNGETVETFAKENKILYIK